MHARGHRPRSAVLLALVAMLSACPAEIGQEPVPATPSTVAPTSVPPSPASSLGPSPSTSPSPPPSVPAAPVTPAITATPTPEGSDAGTLVAIHVESRVPDHPTDEFRATAEAVLTDARGWRRAGFVFDVHAAEAPYRLVLAEGGEVDQLCLPLDTGGRYSCQNGPVVALNAERWRTATPSWTGTLDEYRTMLVNHEIGHLLHLHHPMPQCPGPGLPAPVMMQQSSELGQCVANPWPLQWEVDLAARQAEPLAPPPEHETSDHQPSPPPATS